MDQLHSFAIALQPLHLLKHPFYQDWMRGTLSAEELKDYAGQYYPHIRAFPRYISTIHSLCERDSARQILLENLNDEEGINHGPAHPELWLRFAEGLGTARESIQRTAARGAIENVIATYFRLARSSYHEGLGALYAYEHQIPEIAESKIGGLKTHYNVTDSRTLEFFETHQSADVYHRQALEKIIDALPSIERQEALQAAQCAAQTLWDFLTDVHRDAEHVTFQ